MTDPAAIDLVKRAKAAAAILAKYPGEIYFGAQLYNELAAEVEALREHVKGLKAQHKENNATYVHENEHFTERAEAAEAHAAELAAALEKIGQSGPVDMDGNDDAEAGWSWCYDRANDALAATPADALERARAKDAVINESRLAVSAISFLKTSALSDALDNLDALSRDKP